MASFGWFFCTFLLFFMVFVELANATKNYPEKIDNKIYQKVYVDPSGHGNFTTIQKAIDFVPMNNMRWILIRILPGVYREQISIPMDKQYIYLKGDEGGKTIVTTDDNDTIADATFVCDADNTLVESISFINSYNYPPDLSIMKKPPRKQAVAALISGDKCFFYKCTFRGVQDTLWDNEGRHFFKDCTIEGCVDFIFGDGRSRYQNCRIIVNAGSALGTLVGFITAHGRTKPNDVTGFVFINCNVTGNGKTFLGRPWRPYPRVLFYSSFLSNVILPQGWAADKQKGHEENLTFAEYRCRGPGSDTSKRVPWKARLSKQEFAYLIGPSFIDEERWISQTPHKDFL